MKLTSKVDIPLSSTRMVHDFAVTENHVIIPDLPMEFDIEHGLKKGNFPMVLNKEKPCRYGVMKRNN